MKTELMILQESVDQIEHKLSQLLSVISANDKCGGDLILNVDELASYLKVDANWIYQRTRRHEIPYIKKGKRCLFRKSNIDAWLNQDAIKPLAPFTPSKKIQ